MRASPIRTRRRVARVSTASAAAAAASFNPVVVSDTPTGIRPPDVASITQSQNVPSIEPSIAAANVALAAATSTARKLF